MAAARSLKALQWLLILACLPFLISAWTPVRLPYCLAPIVKTPGCPDQIFLTFLEGPGFFTRSCCKAIKKTSRVCLSILFSHNPRFPPLLWRYCSPLRAQSPWSSLSPWSPPTEALPPAEAVEPELLKEDDQSGDVGQCLSTLSKVPGCIPELFSALFSGKLNSLEPACCAAIDNISNKCWSQVFPYNPFFTVVLRSVCKGKDAVVDGYSRNSATSSSSVDGLQWLPPVIPLPSEVGKCLLPVVSVPGCIEQIYASLIGRRIFGIGPICCNAIKEVSDSCWARVLPFNPSFPVWLQEFCSGSEEAAPAPQPKPFRIEALGLKLN